MDNYEFAGGQTNLENQEVVETVAGGVNDVQTGFKGRPIELLSRPW